jgi:hypothetical protein
MLPDHFVLVADLPLTSSSKVDERRLLTDAGLSPPGKPPEPSVSSQLSHMEINSLVKGTTR